MRYYPVIWYNVVRIMFFKLLTKQVKKSGYPNLNWTWGSKFEPGSNQNTIHYSNSNATVI